MPAPMLASLQFWIPALSVDLPLQVNKVPFAQCRTATKGFRLALDDIERLIDAGKEKVYLTDNEVKT